MITGDELVEILEIYTKHGWDVACVLVSQEFKPVLISDSKFSRLANLAQDSDIDAIWFSRKRADGDIAWEIRHLSPTPFALCESFPLNAAAEQIEAGKRKMEDRIRERGSK